MQGGSGQQRAELPGGSEGRPPLWLTVGIPTVPRPQGPGYLLETLESLAEELPRSRQDLLWGRVQVSSQKGAAARQLSCSALHKA